MTALRLAEHVAHTVDVDVMLSRMTHEQFNEWMAKDIVEPIGSDSTNTILAKIGVLIAAFMGNKDVTMQSFRYWDTESELVVSDDVLFRSLEIVGGRQT